MGIVKHSTTDTLARGVRFDRSSPDGQGFGLRSRQGDAWFETPPKIECRFLDVKRLWLRPQLRERTEWNAHIRRRVHRDAVERPGHDTHDHEPMPVQHDRPPDGF